MLRRRRLLSRRAENALKQLIKIAQEGRSVCLQELEPIALSTRVPSGAFARSAAADGARRSMVPQKPAHQMRDIDDALFRAQRSTRVNDIRVGCEVQRSTQVV